MSSASNKYISSLYLFLVLGTASLPLGLVVGKIAIVPPYFFITPYFSLAFFALIMHNGKLLLSLPAKLYCLAPILMMALVAKCDDQIGCVNHTLPYLFGMLVFLTTNVLIRHFSLQTRSLVTFAYWFVAVQSIIVLLQVFVHPDIGIAAMYFGGGEQTQMSWQGAVRASGTFGNPNLFAQFFVLMSSVVLADLIFTKKRLLQGTIFIGVTGLIVSLTISRSGLLFYLTVNGLFIIRTINLQRDFKIRFFLKIFLIVLVGIGVTTFSFIVLSDSHLMRFAQLEDAKRLETYFGAIKLAIKPSVTLFGVGAGQFFEGAAKHEIYFLYKNWLDPGEIAGSVHNIPLKLLSESGLIVTSIYFISVLTYLRRAFRNIWTDDLKMRYAIGVPLLLLFAVPLQLTTTGASIWIICVISIYLAIIEAAYWRNKNANF